MKIKLLPLAVAALIATPAFAEPTLYGKANVSYQLADDGSDSVTELVSNASRIGVKGSEKLEGGSLEVIYQAEFQVDFADGSEGDSPFSQRNIYIGLKGDFGTVKAGKFDSPLKVSQNKIDLFNDLAGDIKHMVTVNDNRPSNVVQYTTPTASGFSGSLAVINSEDEAVDDGFSGLVSYTLDDLYVSVARDEGVEEQDSNATRVVGQYSMGDIQLGALYEAYEAADADSENGWLVSAKYKLDAWALKLQAGQSDIKEAGGQTVSLGADRKLSKAAKLFFYYTAQESDVGTDDNYLGAGVELKF